ncbi:MAG: hypothetical protein SVR08_14275 [Spirochaetota bacterium]|nr:hypothetical protein [Spirochaetota bacterium]
MENIIQYKKKYSILATIITLILCFNLFNPNIDHDQKSDNLIILSGISSTIDDTTDVLTGLGRFISTISAAFTAISSIFGFKAIILFVIVLFFGAGLTFIGVPRGKSSFFTSLIIIDLVWFIWLRSFNKESWNFILPMLKTNLILLLPIIFFFLLRRIVPIFFTRIRIPFLKRRIMSNNEIIDMSERYQEVSSQFQKSLIRDILHKKDDKIILSGSTQNHIKQLEKIIKKFQE